MAHPSNWRHDRRHRQSPSVSGGSWSEDDTDKAAGPGHKPADNRRPYSPVAETVSSDSISTLNTRVPLDLQPSI